MAFFFFKTGNQRGKRTLSWFAKLLEKKNPLFPSREPSNHSSYEKRQDGSQPHGPDSYAKSFYPKPWWNYALNDMRMKNKMGAPILADYNRLINAIFKLSL